MAGRRGTDGGSWNSDEEIGREANTAGAKIDDVTADHHLDIKEELERMREQVRTWFETVGFRMVDELCPDHLLTVGGR